MTDRLVKVIDYSLLPFALTVLSKTVGLYLVLTSLNIQWGVADFSNSLISVTPLVLGKDVQLVASYSNLVLYASLFLVTALLLLVENLKQQAHLNPTGSKLRIFLLSNASLMQKGWQAYTRLFVWMVFLWLSTLYILSDFAFGRSYAWVAVIATVCSIACTAILIMIWNREQQSVAKPTAYQLGVI